MNNLFAVYDSCSGLFGDPFVSVNEACAKRAFVNALSSPTIPQYVRDDSVLYAIGFFDSKTGCFTADVPPYVVLRGSSIAVPDVQEVNPNEA